MWWVVVEGKDHNSSWVPDSSRFELVLSSQAELRVHPLSQSITGQVLGSVGTGGFPDILTEPLFELRVLDW